LEKRTLEVEKSIETINGKSYGVEICRLNPDAEPDDNLSLIRLGSIIFVIMTETKKEVTSEYIRE